MNKVMLTQFQLKNAIGDNVEFILTLNSSIRGFLLVTVLFVGSMDLAYFMMTTASSEAALLPTPLVPLVTSLLLRLSRMPPPCTIMWIDVN
jgi:hypothetical protein